MSFGSDQRDEPIVTIAIVFQLPPGYGDCDWRERDRVPATTMMRNLAPPLPRQVRAAETSNPLET